MSSITDQNKKITRDFFEALSTGSNKYLDFYTDDSIIWTAGNNSIGGTRTKKEVLTFAENILSVFPSGITFNITGITAEDERVAVEISGEAIHASGETYNNQYHFLLRIKDGKILELKEYMDTQLAAKILLGE
ncbi:nuclear transport factor 2 family protein [Gammaproteobacteria bacterium]|nr:nuclear transport factor 2 family protein [Gammaproteobacteria bacterium]MDB9940037.1 nuclear transport factor 2 family protein [Gammaproteobacteria bacterium]